MYFSTNMFAIIATWLSQLLFFSAILPQIWLNFKRKSTKGFSDALLFAYLNGYFAYLIYIFGLNLPIAYKIIVPNTFMATLVLFFQRFKYADLKNKKAKKLFTLFICNIFLFFTVLLFYFKFSYVFGQIFGYTSSLIFSMCYFPQIFSIYKNKSTKGFSFALISLFTLGDMVELFGAIVLKLPLPTIINNLRAVVIYLIFSSQFFIYSRLFKRFSKHKISFAFFNARTQISQKFNPELFLVKINNVKFIRKKIRDFC
ncbi:hypothetical protein GF385_00510 [Candidatus Dependentiae bacterium]|nr:hypothetical protein [Candidatus Dependentiae bacterium]